MTAAARGARRAGRHSRWSASLAVALAVHGAILALVAGSAIVRLDVVPVRIDLAFLEASDRTAGPGDPSPDLRVAAPAPGTAPSPLPAAPREPAPEEARSEPLPDEAEPVVRLETERVKKPAPPADRRPPPRANEDFAAKRAPKAAHEGNRASTPAGEVAAGGATNSAGAAGIDASSTAPAWAPAARVRYEQLLFAWMDRHKQYPLLAQRRGLEGNGSVRVRIRRDGRVVERELVESTGESMLDQAALDMVHRANPFPAVPAGYGGDTFEFVAPIQYRLR